MDAGKFRLVREQDFKCLPDNAGSWLSAWEVDMGHDGILRDHRSADDLLTYMNAWNEKRFSHYFDAAPQLIKESFEITRRVYQSSRSTTVAPPDLGAPLPVDYYNAEDFTFQNPAPVPSRAKVARILDIGPGFGRQINLWAQRVPNLVYCGMEAIENGYCVQNMYYRAASVLPVNDYIDDPDGFQVTAEPGIYHLPTWRYDLLPSNFFDMILAVQVLPELQDRLVRLLLDQFARCLKTGGALYIRDHDLKFLPTSHTLDLHRFLPTCGFQLEFLPDLRDMDEIHGVPRLWRKVAPENRWRPASPYNPPTATSTRPPRFIRKLWPTRPTKG